MAVQYINSPEKDFSLGIDSRSAENQIDPGFVKDLLNADIVEKRVRKRKGYQGYAGNLPIRVTELEFDNSQNEVCFTLDNSVSLESLRSSPIVVYGRSSSFAPGSGPFTTSGDAVKYYPAFRVPVRKLLSAPGGVLTIPNTEHQLGTTNAFVNAVESTSLINRSYQQIITDSISINESSFLISIDYTLATSTNALVYYSNKNTVNGESYVYTATGIPVGSQVITIPAATHALSNFDIIAQVQQDTGTERIQIVTDSVLIQTNGDVTITLTNGTGSAQDYYVILSAAPVPNTVSGVVGAGSSGSVIISDVTSPWIFYGIYLEQTPGGVKELVKPDGISYDDSTLQVTLSFTNSDAIAKNFIVFYEYGTTRSNQLCVDDTSLSINSTDARPQLSIWGLDFEEVYSQTSKFLREAWVTHVDSYRRSGEQRLICGLGGNLFDARTYAEAATQYAYPLLYPRLNARSTANRILAPLLWDTAETPARTRGYITADASGTHWAQVTAVAFDSGNGWTKYTISLPNKQILDSSGSPTSLSSVISVTSGLEDWLAVQDMSYSRHNGTFRIRQLLDGINLVQIWVENSTNSSDYDDANTGGEAGIFTDQHVWSTSAPFIPRDVLISDALGDSFVCNVLSSSGSTTVSDGIVDILNVPGGVTFLGRRVSNIIPLRNAHPTAIATSDNLVRGDMLSYFGPDRLNSTPNMERLLRVLHVNSDSDRTIDISVSSGVATVTLGSGDTSYLSPGMNILIIQAGIHSGIHTIESITSNTTFSFTTQETDTVTGATLVGETAEIDEELDWEDTAGDTVFLTCDSRWIPIEAPDDSFNLTPSTYINHLDSNSYDDQPFLRSTMVVDNMYLTNGSDEVMKVDGTNIYRSGLPAWQPGLFLTQDTSTTAKIVINNRSISYSAISAAAGRLTISSGDVNALPISSTVRLSGSGATYTVREYTNDLTNYYLFVDRSLDASVSATGTAAEIATFRYYFRLNAVDSNENIIVSAVTGYQDHVVELTANASVHLKLAGFPAWDNYAYDRLEVQIYRTKQGQVAPFYLVTTIPLDFDNTQGYVNYTDSFADSDLTDLDKVNTALKGQELGTNWSDPLRARYVTSSGNRLILGHLKDYPQLDIQIVANGTVTNSTYAGDSLLFRRDNEDSGTISDMVNRVRYEWINGATGTASTYLIPGNDTVTFTTSSPTGAAIGDWIYLSYSATSTTNNDLTYSGWWQISAISGTSITFNLIGAAAAPFYPDSYTVATDPTDVPVLLGTDGNLGMVNGDSFDTFDAMRRMSMAINSTMRQVDTTITVMSTFTPWLMTRGGNDLTPAGRLLVRQPRSDSITFELVPTFSGYQLFVNSIMRSTGDQISASTRVYPSRIIASYENYPEIFDNPTSILDVESDSAIDINSADGQEITGVVPFFGEAAFTAAQQAAILVVFKTNSIYLVDVNQKVQGNNPVQRIETEGLGCTAPYSIAVTKKGIMFANESGIYCLRRDQSIQYIGKYMERNWTERVSIPNISIAQGHHYGIGRVYKLSVPLEASVNTDTGYVENSEAFVYNHTGEDEGKSGAWGRYDNHPAIGWANLGSDAFFATTNGRVFSIRNTGLRSDFRDDNEAIIMSLEARPNDFGNSGIRKTVDRVIVHYRNATRSTGTSLNYSVDLEQQYTPTTSLILAHPSPSTGLADPVVHDILTIVHNVGRRRCVYFGVQIENSNIDESVDIAGVDYKVGGLSDKGIKAAASTSND